MNPTVTPEKHEPPALATETTESLYHPSESSEYFESAKEVKGTCSSSEIPRGLTAETPGSFYHPSESSEDSDSAKEAKGSSRKALNAFLACWDVSPIRRQLLTSRDSIARRTQRHHIRKARQVVIAALEEIAPGNAEILLNKLVVPDDVAQTEDEVDLTLVDALAECYKNASHWSTRRQILSIIADKVSYRTLQSWIPGLTRYRFNIARQHAHMYEGGAEVETRSVPRMYVSQLEHFLDFITSEGIIQELPFGEQTLKLSFPDVGMCTLH